MPGQLPGFVSYAVVPAQSLREEDVLPGEMALLRPGTTQRRRLSFMLGRQAGHEALTVAGYGSQAILAGSRREPVWPEGVCGSITHTTEVGAALVGPADKTDGIGIDFEVSQSAPELDSTVLVPEELEWLDRLESAERAEAVLCLFSAKECIYKAFFPRVQTYFGFDRATLTPGQDGFTARLQAGIDPDYPPERSFRVNSGSSNGLVRSWLVLPKT